MRRQVTQRDLRELLSLVLSRVHSHANRTRLRTVCRQWRLRPPPGSSSPSLTVQPTAVPLDHGDIEFRISTGSMLFLVHRDRKCCR